MRGRTAEQGLVSVAGSSLGLLEELGTSHGTWGKKQRTARTAHPAPIFPFLLPRPSVGQMMRKKETKRKMFTVLRRRSPPAGFATGIGLTSDLWDYAVHSCASGGVKRIFHVSILRTGTVSTMRRTLSGSIYAGAVTWTVGYNRTPSGR